MSGTWFATPIADDIAVCVCEYARRIGSAARRAIEIEEDRLHEEDSQGYGRGGERTITGGSFSGNVLEKRRWMSGLQERCAERSNKLQIQTRANYSTC